MTICSMAGGPFIVLGNNDYMKITTKSNHIGCGVHTDVIKALEIAKNNLIECLEDCEHCSQYLNEIKECIDSFNALERIDEVRVSETGYTIFLYIGE